jgi:hypothetical protein
MPARRFPWASALGRCAATSARLLPALTVTTAMRRMRAHRMATTDRATSTAASSLAQGPGITATDTATMAVITDIMGIRFMVIPDSGPLRMRTVDMKDAVDSATRSMAVTTAGDANGARRKTLRILKRLASNLASRFFVAIADRIVNGPFQCSSGGCCAPVRAFHCFYSPGS